MNAIILLLEIIAIFIVNIKNKIVCNLIFFLIKLSLILN